MGAIRVTGDLNYDKWQLDEISLSPSKNVLQIGFKSLVNGDSYVEFNGLKFGFFLYDVNGDVVHYASYPPVGTKYESTGQPYIVEVPLNTSVNSEYSLHVWAEDAGKFYDFKTTINTPKYDSPFPSWIWNNKDEQWEAPLPHPTDGNIYVWNEEDGSWKFIDPSVTYSDKIIVDTSSPSDIPIL